MFGVNTSTMDYDTIFEFPTLCIPYAPAVFTVDEVIQVFEPYGRVFNVDEVVNGNKKVFFVHFNPGVMDTTMREMYETLHLGKPVKVWVREKWFWHIRLTTPETVQPVGWEYERWDGTGDYKEFASEQIFDTTSIVEFLDAF
jgi:hypothetical protein